MNRLAIITSVRDTLGFLNDRRSARFCAPSGSRSPRAARTGSHSRQKTPRAAVNSLGSPHSEPWPPTPSSLWRPGGGRRRSFGASPPSTPATPPSRSARRRDVDDGGKEGRMVTNAPKEASTAPSEPALRPLQPLLLRGVPRAKPSLLFASIRLSYLLFLSLLFSFAFLPSLFSSL